MGFYETLAEIAKTLEDARQRIFKMTDKERPAKDVRRELDAPRSGVSFFERICWRVQIWWVRRRMLKLIRRNR